MPESIEFQDLPKSTGTKNPAGYTEELLVIPISHIASFPDPPTWANPGDTLRLAGPIVVKDEDTQGFAKWYITKKTAQLLISLVGQPDSKNFDAKFKVKRPGIDLGIMEQMLLDEEYCYAIRPQGCGSQLYYVFGSACAGAEIMNAEYDSSVRGTADGFNGWLFDMHYFGTDIGEIDVATNPLPMLPEVI